jgi:hypothetical protein
MRIVAGYPLIIHEVEQGRSSIGRWIVSWLRFVEIREDRTALLIAMTPKKINVRGRHRPPGSHGERILVSATPQHSSSKLTVAESDG